jgi:pimeloyl-ACP methyl ester carboxylesterase
LNYIDEGAGLPPIVFVHGFLCRHQDWRYQVSHFKAAHRVVACNLRGHGDTPRGDAPLTMETLGGDVAALLEALDLTGAVLVGHSMGCRVVMEARRQAAGRVAGLLLVDGSRGGVDPTTATVNFDSAVAEHGYAAVARGLFEGMFFDNLPSWKDETVAHAAAQPESIGKPLFRALIGWDAAQLEAALSEIDVPVLAIQSSTMGTDRVRRPLAPGEQSPYQALILERVAGAESETLSGPGHFCMTEAPDAINARIKEFIETRI